MKLREIINGVVHEGALTTEHEASSCGRPVLVLEASAAELNWLAVWV